MSLWLKTLQQYACMPHFALALDLFGCQLWPQLKWVMHALRACAFRNVTSHAALSATAECHVACMHACMWPMSTRCGVRMHVASFLEDPDTVHLLQPVSHLSIRNYDKHMEAAPGLLHNLHGLVDRRRKAGWPTEACPSYVMPAQVMCCIKDRGAMQPSPFLVVPAQAMRMHLMHLMQPGRALLWFGIANGFAQRRTEHSTADSTLAVENATATLAVENGTQGHL
jgi:hypothetical protein